MGRLDKANPDAEFWKVRYGTVPHSMMTLFEMLSNPDLSEYHGKLEAIV